MAQSFLQRPNVTTFFYRIGYINFFIFHIASFGLLQTGINLGAVTFGLLLYIIRLFATSAFFHRLFTHKSFSAPKVIVYIGCLVACSAGQMGPIWWKAHHLNHHGFTETDQDPHSPHSPTRGLQGIFHAQIGWLFTHFIPSQLPEDGESDLILVIIDRLHFVPLGILGMITWHFLGSEYFYALCVSTTALFYSMSSLNSICHTYGEQTFSTNDQSRNNDVIAFLTMGEGWHNTHHAFPQSARFGFGIREDDFKQLFDPTYSLILLMHRLGLCSRPNTPTVEQILKRRTSKIEEFSS